MIPSASRTAAIGKYLVALSASLKKSPGVETSNQPKEKVPSERRKQLHLLYFLNDILHHAKYHNSLTSSYATLISNLQPHITNLYGYAAAYDQKVYAGQRRKTEEILNIWEEESLLDRASVKNLRAITAKAAEEGYPEGSKGVGLNGQDTSGDAKKDTPFIMPTSHGDPSTPYYDLPAANMLPHIIPNSTIPINPQSLRPLQFVTGPADESLAQAIKDFLRKMESLDEQGLEEDAMDIDIDELGQLIQREEMTGEALVGDGYYGWSQSFCEKMKRTGKKGIDLSNSAIQDDSIERTPVRQRKRRYTDSLTSRSDDRDRSGSVEFRDGKKQKRSQRSSSRSRSRSERRRSYQDAHVRARSRTRSLSYSPPPPPSHQPSLRGAHAVVPPPPIAAPPQHSPFHHTLPAPPPLGPGRVPVPPPRPPGYRGPWPPPPPPMQFPVPPPPPLAPRDFQNDDQPSQRSGGWSQTQQHQFSPGVNYSKERYGRAQPAFAGQDHDGRTERFGRGGPSR
ncbi:hypothetical protein MMC21_006782 [Puttea exsequens]|nr:hypothetical protein [Puttea exsequens]